MLDTEKIKYEQLIENLKTIASMRHCYEENDYYDYPPPTLGQSLKTEKCMVRLPLPGLL